MSPNRLDRRQIERLEALDAHMDSVHRLIALAREHAAIGEFTSLEQNVFEADVRQELRAIHKLLEAL